MKMTMEEFRHLIKEEAEKADLSLMKWQDYIVDMLHADYADEIELEGFHSSGYPVTTEISFNFTKPTEPTNRYTLTIIKGFQDWHFELSDGKGVLASGSPKKLFGNDAVINNHKDLYGAIENLLTQYVIPNVAEQYPSTTDTSMAQQSADDQQKTQTDMRTEPLKKDIQVIDTKLQVLGKKEEKLKNDLAVLTKQSAPLKIKRQKDTDKIQDMEKGLATEDVMLEGKMPPGFTKDDVESLKDFLEDELGPNADTNEAEKFSDAPARTMDLDKLKQMRKSQTGKLLDPEGKPYPILHRKTIVSTSGRIINNEKLKKLFLIKPKTIIDVNKKMKHSGGGFIEFFDISLPAFRGLYYDKTDDDFKVITTCPHAKDCIKGCFAQKGGFVQWPQTSLSYSRMFTYLMNDWNAFKHQLTSEINHQVKVKSRKNLSVGIRWHDSGDFFAEKYLDMALEIAKETPEAQHYAYTKSVSMIKSKGNKIPDNFSFTFSFGGDEDSKIGPNDKYAKKVPREIFKPFIILVERKEEPPPEAVLSEYKVKDIRYYFKSKEDKEQFIVLMHKTYPEIKKGTLISYRHLMTMPYRIGEKHVLKWAVYVGPGDGDDSAYRRDVKAVYLFEH